MQNVMWIPPHREGVVSIKVVLIILRGVIMKQRINFIGVCITMLLVMVGSADAATKYLEWSFEDVTTTSFRESPADPYVQAYLHEGTTADSTGNGHSGTLDNTIISGWTPGQPLPGIEDVSPIAAQGSAVHFRADDTVQRVKAFPAIEPSTFSTGISMRAIWQFDEEAPASSRYQMMQQGGPGVSGNDTMQVHWDRYGTEYIMVFCDGPSGYRYKSALRSTIETAIGHSMIGNPIVFTATYDGTVMALYADGVSVMNHDFGSAQPIGTGYDRVEIGNDSGESNAKSRKAIVDEFSIWQGALTATEVGVDYDALVIPEPITIGLFALGGLFLRKRKA